MKKKQMKKYYLQGTAEELKIGDMIELDLTKDLPNDKVVHQHFECKFIPELIPLLIEEGVIEVQEIKEKKPKKQEAPKENDSSVLDMIKTLAQQNIKLASRINALEQMMKEISLNVAHSASPVNEPKPRRNARKANRK